MKTRLLSRLTQLVLVVCALSVGGSALDRDAFTFVSYDLHAHVDPGVRGFSAEGKITLRNDSQSPQKNLSLQVSSTLDWKSIRVAGRDVLFSTQPYQSDVDHTGVVNEAVVTLSAPVQPQQTIEVEVSYEGEIPADSTRLTRIGTPEAVALGNDWDRISAEFSAVRGVGYVCWYPVSMEPANLSEGNRYFDVIGEWKRRNANASMKLRLESVGAGTLISNGQLLSTTAHEGIGSQQGSTRESVFSFNPIGEFPPTFAVADFANLDRPAVTVSYVPDHKAAAEEFVLDTEKILPDLTDWFGPARERIRVVELADPNSMPFDSGAMVFTPLRTSDTKRVEVQMAHPIAHACLPSTSRLWIGEGLAQFAQALTRERQDGRKAALAWMNAYIAALVSAEEQALAGLKAGETETKDTQPAAPSASLSRTGESLVKATDPAFYNIKAMFVWWMLRDIVGDEALQRAVRAYDPAKDKEPATMQRLIEAQSKRDLEWFFDSWVYRDRGLPDFRVESAFSRPLLASGDASPKPPVVITVTVENIGNAGAEVPIVVHTGMGDVTARVVVNGKSKAVQRIQAPADPVSITVNDGSVPEANITNNTFKFQAK